MFFRNVTVFLVLVLLSCAGTQAHAAANRYPHFSLILRHHAFQPQRLVIPAGQKVILEIHNQDATPEEFESHEFNREKLVMGGQAIRGYVGPLKAGTYAFFGDFHPKQARGVLVVK